MEQLGWPDILVGALISIIITFWTIREQQKADFRKIIEQIISIEKDIVHNNANISGVYKELNKLRDLTSGINNNNMRLSYDFKEQIKKDSANLLSSLENEFRYNFSSYKDTGNAVMEKQRQDISYFTSIITSVSQDVNTIKFATGAVKLDQELMRIRSSIDGIKEKTSELNTNIISQIQIEHESLAELVEKELKHHFEISSQSLSSQITQEIAKVQVSEKERSKITKQILQIVLGNANSLVDRQLKLVEDFYIEATERTREQISNSLSILAEEVRDLKGQLSTENKSFTPVEEEESNTNYGSVE